MYYCLNCENRFDEPIQSTWGEVTTMVCPNCKDNDFEKLVPCGQCSDSKLDDGDKYCYSCKAETDKEISEAIRDIKSRWDAELVDEVLVKWVEDL